MHTVPEMLGLTRTKPPRPRPRPRTFYFVLEDTSRPRQDQHLCIRPMRFPLAPRSMTLDDLELLLLLSVRIFASFRIGGND